MPKYTLDNGEICCPGCGSNNWEVHYPIMAVARVRFIVTDGKPEPYYSDEYVTGEAGEDTFLRCLTCNVAEPVEGNTEYVLDMVYDLCKNNDYDPNRENDESL